MIREIGTKGLMVRQLLAAAGPGLLGAAQRVELTPGRLYELRVSADVAFDLGSDTLNTSTPVVSPLVPLRFIASAESHSLAAATTTATTAWFYREQEQEGRR